MDIRSARPDALHPVSAHERIDLIDVVRGFALFGVLHLVLLWYGDILLTDAFLRVEKLTPPKKRSGPR